MPQDCLQAAALHGVLPQDRPLAHFELVAPRVTVLDLRYQTSGSEQLGPVSVGIREAGKSFLVLYARFMSWISSNNQTVPAKAPRKDPPSLLDSNVPVSDKDADSGQDAVDCWLVNLACKAKFASSTTIAQVCTLQVQQLPPVHKSLLPT